MKSRILSRLEVHIRSDATQSGVGQKTEGGLTEIRRPKALGLPIVCGIFVLGALAAKEAGIFAILKSKVAIGKQGGGIFLLPTNQLLRPWGEQTVFSGRPVDVVLDSKKRLLAVLNSYNVLIMDGSTGTKVAEVTARATSYAGLAFRPGDRELWASEASLNGPDSMLIAEFSDLGIYSKTRRIELPGHPVPTGIAFSSDGATAYVAFSRNNSLAVIDAQARKVIQEIPVGIAPFGVALTKAGTLYVSNRGGRRAVEGDTVAPSSGSQVVTDPLTGSSVSGTVSVVNAQTFEVRELPVGLAPSGLALSPE